MTFLPIVERELRVRARGKWTYRFRLFAAMAAILFVGFLLVLSEGFSAPGRIGGIMFLALAWTAFLYCLMEGARNTADCLSEEKRAGTLGLLFLTDLRGHDVVLGKLMATSLNSFYGLLSIFPPLGVPLVLGGVTVGEFWRMILVLMTTLVFSLSSGMLISAVCRNVQRAWGGTALLVAGITVVPPMVNALGLDFQVGPMCAFTAMFDGSYQASPGDYWSAIASLMVCSVVFLSAASLVLPYAWQDWPATRRGSARWVGPAVETRRARAARQMLLDVNPVVWLAGRGARRRLVVWLAVLVLSVIGIGLWSVAMGSRVVAIAILVMFLLLHLGLSMWVASEACSLFAGAKDSGALDLLLCSPLSLREILDGYVLGLKRLFIQPLLVLLGVEALLLAGYLVAARLQGLITQQQVWFTLILVSFTVVAAVMDTFAVARYGMWAGLMARRPGVALGKTLGFVLIGPLVIGGWCMLLWPVLALVKNLIFIAYAHDRLRKHFRIVVTERYTAGDDSVVIPPRGPGRLDPNMPPVLPR